MKTIIALFLIVMLSGSVFGQSRPGSYPWNIGIKIVDESGSPVSAAKVAVFSPQGELTEGLTDMNGLFDASKTNASCELGIEIQKAGYYFSRVTYDLYLPGQFDDRKVAANRNANLTLMLKKIGKPISMYAKREQIEIPEIDKPIGFDLTIGDWVAPYGKGIDPDLNFLLKRRWASRNDFDSTVNVTFSHRGDGVIPVVVPLNQGSALRMISIAPADGYVAQLSKSLNHTPGTGWKKDQIEDENYYIRVRTAIDSSGNIVSAHYGKIYGDFSIDPISSRTAWIIFTYYLNPTPNSRNVEFDPKQNLLRNLSLDEVVKAP